MREITSWLLARGGGRGSGCTATLEPRSPPQLQGAADQLGREGMAAAGDNFKPQNWQHPGFQLCHLPSDEGHRAGLLTVSPASCKGSAKPWQHTGAQACQGRSVYKGQRVKGRHKPFLSPVQRAPLCLSIVTEFVSLILVHRHHCQSRIPSKTRTCTTPGARTLGLCRQGVTPAAPREAVCGDLPRGWGRAGLFVPPRPLKG